MMSIDDAVLTEFVLGSLPPNEQATVANAVAASPALKREVRALTELFGGLGAEPVTASSDLRARVMASANSRPRFAAFVHRLAGLLDRSPLWVRELLNTLDRADRWLESPWPQVRFFDVTPGPSLSGAEVGFVLIPPGGCFPAHEHQGQELNLVLQGALRLATGESHGAGTVFEGNSTTSHDFCVLDGPDLIMMAILHGALVFTDGSTYGPVH